MTNLNHFDEQGASRMIDTSDKEETQRMARASATIRMEESTANLIRNKELSKGDVFEVARIAGIGAAKKTWDLIPLCHPLAITGVKLDFSFLESNLLQITSVVKVFGRTGVEMEALTAVSVAALTVYDMCKAVDKVMVIAEIRLNEKTGGKSGSFVR